MNVLKKALVVSTAAAALAVSAPGIASADPGTGNLKGRGDVANFFCVQLGYQVLFENHGQCVTYFS
jgi:hypothetical protein